MKRMTFYLSQAFLCSVASTFANTTDRAANTTILDANGVKNLGIEMVEVEERDFETTVFAIGRLEDIPSNRSVLASRIAGRVVALKAFEGQWVEQGHTLVRLESRQPGSPPPTIELKALQGGLVTRSAVSLGDPVEPDKALIEIVDRSKLWAVAKIPEREAPRVPIGTPARLRLPAQSDASPVSAELIRYGVSADRESGTLDGIFELSNSDGHLQPGMRVEFSLIINRREKVMAVPREAVQGDPARRVVFVKDFDLPHAFVKAPVILGEENDTHVEIVSGLFPGDEVVTAGAYALGFVGGSSTMSLKEALDAAHGHEHNEDGSEMTAEQKKAREAEKRVAASGGSSAVSSSSWLMIYAIAVTLLLVLVSQLWWSGRRQPS